MREDPSGLISPGGLRFSLLDAEGRAARGAVIAHFVDEPLGILAADETSPDSDSV